jgi:hypothetical protein
MPRWFVVLNVYEEEVGDVSKEVAKEVPVVA